MRNEMNDKDIIEKLSGMTLEQTILYDKNRLKAIQTALIKMKQLNKVFLKQYELTDTWNKINISLIKNNIQSSLQNIVDFKICETNRLQKTYFNPFSKKPITMCYNKFIKKQQFQKALNYNMILYYDSKMNKKMNWNQLRDVVVSNVRAIHLSKICVQSDRKCIKQELEKRVFEKQRFRGKNLQNLSQLIMQGLQNEAPISQTY